MESVLQLPPLSLRLQRQAGRYFIRSRRNPTLPHVQSILADSRRLSPRLSITVRLKECVSYFPLIGLSGHRASRHRRFSPPPDASCQEPRFTHLAEVAPLPNNVFHHSCTKRNPLRWIEAKWEDFRARSSDLFCIVPDGSAAKNPGKTAFGSNTYFYGHNGFEADWFQSEGYSNLGLIGEAELAGIGSALESAVGLLDSEEYTENAAPPSNLNPKRVVVYSDSRDAIDNIFRPRHQFHTTTPWRLVNFVRLHALEFVLRGWEVHFVWIPGHIGFFPHDSADEHAKRGLESLSEDAPQYGAGVSVAALYAYLDALIRASWKRSSAEWPLLSKRQSKAQWSDCPHANLLRARLRLNAIGNAFLSRVGARDKGGKPISPFCRYCNDKNHVESFEHVARECPSNFFARHRFPLLHTIQSIASAYDSVDASSFHLLLSVHPALSAEDSHIIRRRLNAFLRAIGLLSCGCLSPAPD